MGWSKKMLGLKKRGGEGTEKPEEPSSVTTPVERRKDCPLDKDELGRSTWNLLHTMSVTYPTKPTGEQKKDMADFLNTLSRVFLYYYSF